MANDALLMSYLEAQEDRAQGMPTCAEVRMAVAKRALFLTGVSWDDIEDMLQQVRTEVLITEVELEKL